MALHELALRLLRLGMDSQAGDPGLARRAAMFACHDVVVKPGVLGEVFGRPAADLPPRPDSAEILGWHKAADFAAPVPDTHDLFAALGWTLDAFDILPARGKELLRDLNLPFPPEYHGRYDVVYDNVLGQVFMAGQCLKSAAELVRVGGYLLSVSAANIPNNGFWSVSPTAYHDALTQNGFSLVAHHVVTDPFRAAKLHPFHATTGCELPHGAVNMVLARKEKDLPFAFPTQSKFVRNPASRKAPA